MTTDRRQQFFDCARAWVRAGAQDFRLRYVGNDVIELEVDGLVVGGWSIEELRRPKN